MSVRVVVTGATGFIGRAVLSRLAMAGHDVRILLRPSAESPRLPRGVPVEVALASLTDARGVVAGLLGAQAVFHLAGAEAQGTRADLTRSDTAAAHTLARAAKQAGAERLIFVSHLGADRASAYPVLRAKAEAEEALRQGEVAATVVRCAAVYGPGDRLTTPLAMTLALAPGVFFLPGDGRTGIQPLHVDDLATALVWWLEEDGLLGRTYEVGGPEVLTWREVVGLVMSACGHRRALAEVPPPVLRLLLRLGELTLAAPPFTPFLVDSLATSRTAPLDTLPRAFGLEPRRMAHSLGYLGGRRWGAAWLRRQLGRPGDPDA